MEVSFLPLEQRMPLCRADLYDDVVNKRAYQDICQLWQLPGHLVITTDEGRKLFTFDTKPLYFQHAFDSKCLDISNLSTTLVDVLQLWPGELALVDTSGQCRLWKFDQDFNWSRSVDVELSKSDAIEILSITYLTHGNTLVWCEKQLPSATSSESPTYFICKKQVSSALDISKSKVKTSSSVLVFNCPPCDVHAMSSDILYITTQYDPAQITVHLFIDFIQDKLSVYIGQECMSLSVQYTSEAVDFQQVVMSCLSSLLKAQCGQGDLGVKCDSAHGQIAVLNSTGVVDFYTCFTDSGKRSLSMKSVKLLPATNAKALDFHTKHWFLHNSHIGMLSNNSVHIFHLKDGQQISKSDCESLRNAQRIFPSILPVFLALIVTPDKILAVQGTQTRDKELYTAPDKLPDDHLLQTDALRLAHIQQMKKNGYKHEVVLELEKLKNKWAEVKNLPQHSAITSIIAPYLEEYWRLENLSQVMLESKEQLVTNSDANSADKMVQEIMQTRTLSKTDQHAKLVWLSQVFPQELLNYMCRGINIDCAEVTQSELKKWQSLLGLEGGDLICFECICRLLFQLQPDKLLKFVKCAESVNEQTIGVSAFVRKKHSLMYYKAASQCLPESHTSVDAQIAASVKAKLILASECENAVEKALKYLLQHNLWSQAVELVKKQATEDEEALPTSMHITFTALAEARALSDYVPDLFSVMPSWKSFISFAQVATERPEIRQQQLSTSVKDIFSQGAADVSLASVRSSLLTLVKKMNDQL